MAIGKQIGEYSFKATSTTYTPGPGSAITQQINYQGSATGQLTGVAQGTLTVVAEAGAKSGNWSWCGASYLDNGDIVGATAQGTWEPIGKHKWRLRGAANFSDGRVAATEGEADLQTLAGKLSEWS
jgi:hypothetical protein